jgi:hypothetical protein
VGVRSWLLNKLGGGEPPWIVLTETTPARATWLAQHLEHEGLAKQLRNGDDPAPRRWLRNDRPSVVWVAVREPDLETARRLIDTLAEDGPLGLVTPTRTRFTERTRRYLDGRRRRVGR